jgi:hypothetical protein
MKKSVFKNSRVKLLILSLSLLTMNVQGIYAQGEVANNEKTRQELVNLSKNKWQWMAEKNVDSLENLFHKEAVFVHMGGAMNREQELNTIKSGGIHYKHAEIQETSVRFVGNTAVILDRIRLTAVVGGNEVVNPFMVTEVYVLLEGKWKLASLSFTRLMGM